MEIEMTRTTDPREGKLQEIIARGKASLVASLEEIQQEFANRQDMMVKPSAINFVWMITRSDLSSGTTPTGLLRTHKPKLFRKQASHPNLPPVSWTWMKMTFSART